MRLERRLRSSSEGAGGPRIHGNHRDAPGMEGCGLLKHRNNSSSSKLGSLVSLELGVCVCVLFCLIGTRLYQNTFIFAFEVNYITVLYFTDRRSCPIIDKSRTQMLCVRNI